ncbi:hypothetical protein IBT49_09405 [Erwinia sp. S63]|uniref:hypothetical protein n=1 Tax=Erwinia sp. S63 TaxID=2769341 RepID=UPI00190C1720|nr:hypothetical protein [Erwinia sp. S63]MBK0096195.1 hypothetical protein [Erwinia sp. S63]
MADASKLPPSLADYFDAPEGYKGHFGWLCGYSATDDFLENAVDRFSCLNQATRANHGQIKLAIFLDAGNKPVSAVDVPGVLHCQMKSAPPLNLLHAKVAILGFMPDQPEDTWRLRLVVSTGNWTKETLTESLDLVWCLDLSRDALESVTDDVQQSCADLRAAQNLFEEIASWCDTSLLTLEINDQLTTGGLARLDVNAWLNTCRKYARGKPRLVDNRKSSLFNQLKSWLYQPAVVGKRNYLAMGSGFYEGGRGDKSLVPQKIVRFLQDEDLLTKKPEIDLYVNPEACQAVASNMAKLRKLHITVRPPSQLVKPERTLHAKFIFSANYRNVSDTLTQCWFYMGSGNLTGPGFMQRMKTGVGNLEAGVFFSPERLARTPAGKLAPEKTLTWLLPIQSEIDCDALQMPLQAGQEMDERRPHYAPPVTWLKWNPLSDGQGALHCPGLPEHKITVLASDGTSCPLVQQGYLWQGEMPRWVNITWQSDNGMESAKIPVIDVFGRIAATSLRPLDLEEVLWQLSSFPHTLDVDFAEPTNALTNSTAGSFAINSDDQAVSSQPVRQVMALIEGIAERQTTLPESQWLYWCRSLEQTLIQASENSDITCFKDLGINPLSPLKEAPFRPVYAEDDQSDKGQDYLQMLMRIEQAWGVDSLAHFWRA